MGHVPTYIWFFTSKLFAPTKFLCFWVNIDANADISNNSKGSPASASSISVGFFQQLCRDRLLSPVPPPTSGLWAVWDASAGPVVAVYGLSEGFGEADPLGGSSEISPDND